MGDQALQIFAIVVVALVGMRRDHGVLNAIRGGHAAHALGGFPVPGAVVYFRENVAVDVDHSGYSDLSRFEESCQLSAFGHRIFFMDLDRCGDSGRGILARAHSHVVPCAAQFYSLHTINSYYII